jgi:hypothetical protein
VSVSAEMVPGERSKSAAQALPGSVTFLRLNKTFDNLPEKNETTFLQPFTVFVSLGQIEKNLKNFF